MELKIAGFILLCVIMFAGFCHYYNRKRRIELQEKIKRTWGKRPEKEYSAAEFEAISHYYHWKKKDEFSIDDITWNDLELDIIFMLLNHTWSCVGESYLYALLRTPSFSREELRDRGRLIRFFTNHMEVREQMEYFFANIGKTGSLSMFDAIYNLSEYEEESNKLHYLCIGLFLTTLFIMALNPAIGILCLLSAIVFCWSTYFKKRKKIEPYIISCSYLMKIIKQAEQFTKLQIPELKESFLKIDEAKKKFEILKRNTFFVPYGPTASSGMLDTFAVYLNMTFHFDLIQFRTFVRELKKNMTAFETMTDEMGMIESAIAIASFRELMENWCEPIFQKESQRSIKTENIYHPMIEEPVKNSFEMKKGVLITGSNASGKSTFLKTVAINALLAQTIDTCLADSYSGFLCQIYSSMSLRDDLMSQESYYIVEIKSIKRILDQMEKGVPMLCFVDEVLRGTNTVERIAASSQILKSMIQENVLCFAATHDIELTYILENYYDNYHFEEEVVGNDILFHYHLYDGRATTRNAIKLLSLIGYNDQMIREAEQTAEYFMQTGEWKL